MRRRFRSKEGEGDEGRVEMAEQKGGGEEEAG